MTIFTSTWWWGLQSGGASCARAHCAHWIIRPWHRVLRQREVYYYNNVLPPRQIANDYKQEVHSIENMRAQAAIVVVLLTAWCKQICYRVMCVRRFEMIRSSSMGWAKTSSTKAA